MILNKLYYYAVDKTLIWKLHVRVLYSTSELHAQHYCYTASIYARMRVRAQVLPRHHEMFYTAARPFKKFDVTFLSSGPVQLLHDASRVGGGGLTASAHSVTKRRFEVR